MHEEKKMKRECINLDEEEWYQKIPENTTTEEQMFGPAIPPDDCTYLINILLSSGCTKQNILDVGCGYGRLTPTLSTIFEAVCSVDFKNDPRDKMGNNCVFINGDLRQKRCWLGITSMYAKYSVILLSYTLSTTLTKNISTLIQNCTKVLTHNGYIIIHEFIAKDETRGEIWNDFAFALRTQDEYKNMAQENELTIINTYRRIHQPYDVLTMICRKSNIPSPTQEPAFGKWFVEK